MKLEGKVALVLGSVKGIGRAIAEHFLKEGARVVVTYYDWEESLKDLKKSLASIGGDYLIHRTDLREAESISELMEKVTERFGGLDILLNNIERGGWPVVHGPYTVEQWDLEMATTLRAKQWVFMNAFPLLRKADEGVVINLSSIAGIVGRSGPASFVFKEGYAAANRGISQLTETWARLGAPSIRVNEIMVGFFETRHGPLTRGWSLLNDEQKNAIRDHTLMGRMGSMDDIIKAVCFLIEDAPFMTGSIIKLDGGYTIGGERISPMPKGVL